MVTGDRLDTGRNITRGRRETHRHREAHTGMGARIIAEQLRSASQRHPPAGKRSGVESRHPPTDAVWECKSANVAAPGGIVQQVQW